MITKKEKVEEKVEEEEPKKIESSIDTSTDAEAVASVYTGQTDSDALLTETVKFPGAEEYSIDCPKDFSYEIVDEKVNANPVIREIIY